MHKDCRYSVPGSVNEEKLGITSSAGVYPALPRGEVSNHDSANSIWADEEGECSNHGDLDLKFSKRDREKLEEGLRSQAILQVISEVTGEVYSAAYADEMEKALESCSRRWGVLLPWNSS